MKLSMDTYSIRIKFGNEKAIELIKKAGYDAVDFSFYYYEDCPEMVGEGYVEYARKMRECLDANGIECNQAHAPFKLTYGKRFDETEPAYLEIVRSIEAAAILGAKAIIVHAIGIPDSEKGVDFEEYNREYYLSLLPYAKKYGIKIGVENLFSNDNKRNCLRGILETPEKLSNMVKSLGTEHFCACVDVGHVAITGMEPQDFILGMSPDVLGALHIQDNDYRIDGHFLPYIGKIEWEAVMSALRTIGYEGELTFEVFRFFKGVPNDLVEDALQYSEKVGRYLISEFDGDKIKKFKYYLFDFDGTLMDSMPYWSKSVLSILDEYGVSYPDNLIETLTPLGNGGAAKHVVDVLGLKMEYDEVVSKILETSYPMYRDEVGFKEGVEDYLKLLKKEGVSLNVFTASPHKTVDACLNRLGVMDIFDNVWSCEDFGTTKSNPHIYEMAVERLGGKIEDAVLFDDNIGAVTAAAKSGISTVGVYDKSAEGFKDKMKSVCDYYIDSFCELTRAKEFEKQ